MSSDETTRPGPISSLGVTGRVSPFFPEYFLGRRRRVFEPVRAIPLIEIKERTSPQGAGGGGHFVGDRLTVQFSSIQYREVLLLLLILLVTSTKLALLVWQGRVEKHPTQLTLPKQPTSVFFPWGGGGGREVVVAAVGKSNRERGCACLLSCRVFVLSCYKKGRRASTI